MTRLFKKCCENEHYKVGRSKFGLLIDCVIPLTAEVSVCSISVHFFSILSRGLAFHVLWMRFMASMLIHLLSVFAKDTSQVCKSDQRPSTLPVGPVVTVMGSLQTPTPNSTGESLAQQPVILVTLSGKHLCCYSDGILIVNYTFG